MPNFDVDGLQLFGRLDLLNFAGTDCEAVLTEIYNNTPTTWGTAKTGDTYTFEIVAGDPTFNFSAWSWSVTFTPINLVQPSQGTIPFSLSVTQISSTAIMVGLLDVHGNDFSPSTDVPYISYYVNIRLT